MLTASEMLSPQKGQPGKWHRLVVVVGMQSWHMCGAGEAGFDMAICRAGWPQHVCDCQYLSGV